MRGRGIDFVRRLKAQDGPLGGRDETGTKIRLALEPAGVKFIDENGGGAGARLQKSVSEIMTYAAPMIHELH
jgi:hypothetical protein